MIELLKEIGKIIESNVTVANASGVGTLIIVLAQSWLYSRLRKKSVKVAAEDSKAVTKVEVVNSKVDKLKNENQELKSELAIIKTQNQYVINIIAKGFLSSNLSAIPKEDIAIMYGKANDLIIQTKEKVDELKEDAMDIAGVIKDKYEEAKAIVVPKAESMLEKLKREATSNEEAKTQEV